MLLAVFADERVVELALVRPGRAPVPVRDRQLIESLQDPTQWRVMRGNMTPLAETPGAWVEPVWTLARVNAILADWTRRYVQREDLVFFFEEPPPTPTAQSPPPQSFVDIGDGVRAPPMSLISCSTSGLNGRRRR